MVSGDVQIFSIEYSRLDIDVISQDAHIGGRQDRQRHLLPSANSRTYWGMCGDLISLLDHHASHGIRGLSREFGRCTASEKLHSHECSLCIVPYIYIGSGRNAHLDGAVNFAVTAIIIETEPCLETSSGVSPGQRLSSAAMRWKYLDRSVYVRR